MKYLIKVSLICFSYLFGSCRGGDLISLISKDGDGKDGGKFQKGSPNKLKTYDYLNESLFDDLNHKEKLILIYENLKEFEKLKLEILNRVLIFIKTNRSFLFSENGEDNGKFKEGLSTKEYMESDSYYLSREAKKSNPSLRFLNFLERGKLIIMFLDTERKCHLIDQAHKEELDGGIDITNFYPKELLNRIIKLESMIGIWSHIFAIYRSIGLFNTLMDSIKEQPKGTSKFSMPDPMNLSSIAIPSVDSLNVLLKNLKEEIDFEPIHESLSSDASNFINSDENNLESKKAKILDFLEIMIKNIKKMYTIGFSIRERDNATLIIHTYQYALSINDSKEAIEKAKTVLSTSLPNGYKGYLEKKEIITSNKSAIETAGEMELNEILKKSLKEYVIIKKILLDRRRLALKKDIDNLIFKIVNFQQSN